MRGRRLTGIAVLDRTRDDEQLVRRLNVLRASCFSANVSIPSPAPADSRSHCDIAELVEKREARGRRVKREPCKRKFIRESTSQNLKYQNTEVTFSLAESVIFVAPLSTQLLPFAFSLSKSIFDDKQSRLHISPLSLELQTLYDLSCTLAGLQRLFAESRGQVHDFRENEGEIENKLQCKM